MLFWSRAVRQKNMKQPNEVVIMDMLYHICRSITRVFIIWLGDKKRKWVSEIHMQD